MLIVILIGTSLAATSLVYGYGEGFTDERIFRMMVGTALTLLAIHTAGIYARLVKKQKP